MATLWLRDNGVYYANYSINGRQIRHSLRTTDESKARELLKSFRVPTRRIRLPPASQHPWEVVVNDGLAKCTGWLSILYQRTKDRAISRGIQFRLAKDQLRAIALRSEGQCELTRLRFSWEQVGACQFQPYAPSLDRIIPNDGYSAGNCRLICYAANVALSDWGEEVALIVARALVASKN